jgi:hypothetical protein
MAQIVRSGALERPHERVPRDGGADDHANGRGVRHRDARIGAAMLDDDPVQIGRRAGRDGADDGGELPQDVMAA